MKKIALAIAALAAFSTQAMAVCPSTLQIKDNAGTTENVVYSDSSGNCIPNVVVNGTPAVTLSGSSNAVNATLSAETTKVIGEVNQGTSPWVVSNGGTFAVQAAVPTWAGGTLGTMANYGTSPGAVLVPGVNAFVTNTNANGSATAANSAPVVPPSDYIAGKAISSLVFGTTAAMTGTSSTALLAAVSAKVIYLMNITCTNSSATATLLTLQDGSGGTTLGTMICPAGGGHTEHASFPLVKTTSGNGLYVADVTTSASVIATASGFAQ